MHNHISLLPERRRELEGRIESDDQPEMDDAALEQHLARVRVAAARAVQKGRKSKGCNAVEGVALTVQCGRGGASFLGCSFYSFLTSRDRNEASRRDAPRKVSADV